jgi:hypothetical protein
VDECLFPRRLKSGHILTCCISGVLTSGTRSPCRLPSWMAFRLATLRRVYIPDPEIRPGQR